jgi:hypothetical protein
MGAVQHDLVPLFAGARTGASYAGRWSGRPGERAPIEGARRWEHQRHTSARMRQSRPSPARARRCRPGRPALANVGLLRGRVVRLSQSRPIGALPGRYGRPARDGPRWRVPAQRREMPAGQLECRPNFVSRPGPLECRLSPSISGLGFYIPARECVCRPE